MADAAVPSAVAPAPASAPADCSVALYGDSILYGGFQGSQRLAEPPAATLKRLRPKFRVVDRTRNGESATERAKTFDGEKRASAYVVIQHGVNDAMQSLPLDAPLRGMVAAVEHEGSVAILTGLSRQSVPVQGRERYDATVRKVALDTGAEFADWGSVPYRKEDMADYVHPAKAYSDRLVERIVATLDKVAPQCRT